MPAAGGRPRSGIARPLRPTVDRSRAGADRIRGGLTAAVAGAGRGPAIAERLCSACVDVLDVHGAGLWLTTGADAPLSLATCGMVTVEWDWLQLCAGQGPCWDAIHSSTVISTPDLRAADPSRWPAFTAAALNIGIQAVSAMPVAAAGVPTGVLYLCWSRPGGLTGPALAGAFLAAELAALPLLDVIADTATVTVDPTGPITGDGLGWLTRSQVYQAVGMTTAHLGVHPAEAMLRLRGYAFANDLTVSQVAFLIIERRLELEDDRTGTAGKDELGDWPQPDGWLE